jgi:hypothetical protein
MNRKIPLVIVFCSGIIMVVGYFIQNPLLKTILDRIDNWSRIGLTCAMILGILSLLMNNAKKVALQSPGWIYNLLLLASFLFTFFFAIQYHVVNQNGVWLTVKGTDVGTPAYQIFIYVYTPLSATMFSLTAFFIASAAYRAFRAKNIESALLLVSAILVMLGSIPLGDKLFNALGFEKIFGTYNLSWLSSFIQSVPMAAGQAAIWIGVGIGMVSFSIKILGGIDRSYFGGEQ